MEHLFRGVTCFLCKKNRRIEPRFGECCTYFRCGTKTGMVRILVFFKIGLCSAISFKRSQRELFIDGAERRCTLNNYHYTPYHRFSFMPKAGIAFPKQGFCFFCALILIVVQDRLTVSQMIHGKNGFVTATKLGTANIIFFLFLQPKILLQQPNGLLIELNILLL